MRRATMVLPVPGGPYKRTWRSGAVREWARERLSDKEEMDARRDGANMIPSSTRSPTVGSLLLMRRIFRLVHDHNPVLQYHSVTMKPHKPVAREVSRTRAGRAKRRASMCRASTAASRDIKPPAATATTEAIRRMSFKGSDKRAVAPVAMDSKSTPILARARSIASWPSSLILRSLTSSFKRARCASSFTKASAVSTAVRLLSAICSRCTAPSAAKTSRATVRR
mmetsp:Transcript_4152/g.8890  ORF Transcript_4152/g.8890 Transcript_4152/m.8890 type:complete len:224 (+) Transcript_4152:410-1081(+)